MRLMARFQTFGNDLKQPYSCQLTTFPTMGFTSIDALFLIGMVAVMWFLIIQPKRREQQALTRMLTALKKGDKVITNSGMVGEIASIKDPYITLRFHDNVRIDFDRSAIARIVKDETASTQDSKATQEAKA